MDSFKNRCFVAPCQTLVSRFATFPSPYALRRWGLGAADERAWEWGPVLSMSRHTHPGFCGEGCGWAAVQAELRLVGGAGHSMYDAAITHELLLATDSLREVTRRALLLPGLN